MIELPKARLLTHTNIDGHLRCELCGSDDAVMFKVGHIPLSKLESSDSRLVCAECIWQAVNASIEEGATK